MILLHVTFSGSYLADKTDIQDVASKVNPESDVLPKNLLLISNFKYHVVHSYKSDLVLEMSTVQIRKSTVQIFFL